MKASSVVWLRCISATRSSGAAGQVRAIMMGNSTSTVLSSTLHASATLLRLLQSPRRLPHVLHVGPAIDRTHAAADGEMQRKPHA
jgi:hypothetical protein